MSCTNVTSNRLMVEVSQNEEIVWNQVDNELGILAQKIIQDNELERSAIGKDENFYCNPLLLDGQVFEYNSFSSKTTGELTVVKGNPASEQRTKIPFSVLLRRNGKILERKDLEFLKQEYFQLEISNILEYCKKGDQLIIQPVGKENRKAKRILKLVD